MHSLFIHMHITHHVKCAIFLDLHKEIFTPYELN